MPVVIAAPLTSVSFVRPVVDIEVLSSPAMGITIVGVSKLPIAIGLGLRGPAGPASGESPRGPAFTYSAGVLTRVDYDDGSYKLFSYTGGALSQVDIVALGVTRRKTFNYTAGVLTSVDEVTLP